MNKELFASKVVVILALSVMLGTFVTSAPGALPSFLGASAPPFSVGSYIEYSWTSLFAGRNRVTVTELAGTNATAQMTDRISGATAWTRHYNTTTGLNTTTTAITRTYMWGITNISDLLKAGIVLVSPSLYVEDSVDTSETVYPVLDVSQNPAVVRHVAVKYIVAQYHKDTDKGLRHIVMIDSTTGTLLYLEEVTWAGGGAGGYTMKAERVNGFALSWTNVNIGPDASPVAFAGTWKVNDYIDYTLELLVAQLGRYKCSSINTTSSQVEFSVQNFASGSMGTPLKYFTNNKTDLAGDYRAFLWGIQTIDDWQLTQVPLTNVSETGWSVADSSTAKILYPVRVGNAVKLIEATLFNFEYMKTVSQKTWMQLIVDRHRGVPLFWQEVMQSGIVSGYVQTTWNVYGVNLSISSYSPTTSPFFTPGLELPVVLSGLVVCSFCLVLYMRRRQ